MNFIVAVDENFGIGNEGDLLFHIKKDMAFFRETTMNKVVVMGKNTLLSFPGGRPLKNRVNIVLSSKGDFDPQGATVCKNTEELFKILKNYKSEDIFVIGGAAVYKLLAPYCKKAYITKIRSVKDADTFIDNIDFDENWEIAHTSEVYEENGVNFTFNTYINKNPKNI